MEPSMDQEAVEGAMDREAVEDAMDQEEVEGVMDGTVDESGSSRRSDGWYRRWIRKQSKERWIRKQSKERWIRKQSKERWVVPTMDQEAVEGAMGGTTDGLRSSRRSDRSGRSRRSDGWYKRWIRKQSKERWMIQTMDQEAVE